MKVNKIIKSYLCLAGIIFSILFVNTASAENRGLTSVLKNLSVIKKITATFSEIKTYSLLDDNIKLQGQLEYIAPGTLIKETIKPEAEYFKVTGNDLYVKKADGEEHDLLLNNYPLVEMFVEAYRGILSGNLAKLKQYYEIAFSEIPPSGQQKTQSSWVIKLKPLDDEALDYIDLITINGTDAKINKITTIESGGDKSVMFIKVQNN